MKVGRLDHRGNLDAGIQTGKRDRLETDLALSHLKTDVQTELVSRISELGSSPTQVIIREIIEDVCAKVISSSGLRLDLVDYRRVIKDIIDDFLFLGPLQPFLADDDVTEIAVNGSQCIFIERFGRMELTGSRFADESHLRRIIDRIGQEVNRRCDEKSQMMDARLQDGSRVNAVIAPISFKGSALTIRKFNREHMTDSDLLREESLSPAMLSFLEAAVKGRCSIVVAGGTGSGKTTLLNVLSRFIPVHERVVTIEDAAELQLSLENLVALEARPANIEGVGAVTIYDLVVNALRMRPDRIVVGECRGIEALDMINAMTTGHDGSLTTIHANDVITTFTRLENMIRLAVQTYESRTIRAMIAQAIDLVVVVKRFSDGSRKISSITALMGMEADVITTEELFRFEQTGAGARNGKCGSGVMGCFVGCQNPVPELIKRIESWGGMVDQSWFYDVCPTTEGIQRICR